MPSVLAARGTYADEPKLSQDDMLHVRCLERFIVHIIGPKS